MGLRDPSKRMGEFRFYHPIEVRYEDIDAQRHVNNVRYFTYMEQARARYFQSLGLWDGQDFNAIGIILVEASCTYKAPIPFGMSLKVGVRCARIGHKSLDLEYRVLDAGSSQEMASGRSILVGYDYRVQASIPIPDAWRKKLMAFDHPSQD